MIENIDELIKRIKKYTKESVSQSRYEHSLRTAETCQKFCEKYGLDGKIGYLAGIAHDMCKKLSPEKMISLAKEDGRPVSLLEEANPSLLHGRAASVLIQKKFGVNDRDVIEAIANHTFGHKGLCDLAKLLFVSDKIEPGREHVDEKYMKSIETLTLNQLVYKVVSESKEYLLNKGKKVAPETEEFLKELESGRDI